MTPPVGCRLWPWGQGLSGDRCVALLQSLVCVRQVVSELKEGPRGLGVVHGLFHTAQQ
jgi:hypothetical protein